MKKFEQLDISGDVGLIIRGHSLEELFGNAATGLSDLTTNASVIEETEEREVSLASDSSESLLIQWLNELIFLFDAYGFTGKTFHIALTENALAAKVSGGIFNPEVNESRLLVKAATYHRLKLAQTNSDWEATVIFDI